MKDLKSFLVAVDQALAESLQVLQIGSKKFIVPVDT